MTENKDPLKLMKNDTFCSMAWIHQFLDPTGRVKPCCRFEEHFRPAENNLNSNSLKNIFYGPWMDEVRKKMLAGEAVDGCTRCYQEEGAGKKSLRQRYNEGIMLPIEDLVDVDKPSLRWIELAISNQCNLACRMCDSRYSWKWFDEENESFGKTFSKNKVTKMDIAEIFPFIHDLVHLKFTGGEPLITKEHWILLDKLVSERDCSNMFLNYSTNCTIEPLPKWIETWDQFKYVEFAMSYDSANPLEAEYIRWPAKYETIEKTTKAFFELSRSPKYNLILRTTVSVLNIWSLPETILWWLAHNPSEKIKINPTHLTHPFFLSTTILPIHIKDRIAQKFQSYLDGSHPEELKSGLEYMKNYMYSKDESTHLYRLKEYIEKTDAYRKQDFFKAYPQFDDIFEHIQS